MEIVHGVGGSQTEHCLIYAHAVLKTLHGLALLILITTQWPQPCYYPHFTDGMAEL